jgi:hypothetical protein
MPTSFKISDNLYLVQQSLPKKAQATAVKVESPVNHIAVIDCSGSMYGELPKIREQFKKRIPKLLKKDDTLSVIWFSGRGQFGALLEAEPVATLTELQEINGAIDKYLQCVGLTGFKEPIQEAKKLIERVGKKNKNPFALFFMSDGWDNQWSKQEILKAIEDTSAGLSSATFVEYGNYADRQLLAKMAEKAGGTLIAAEDFDRYAPVFEAAISKKVSGAPRIEVDVIGDVIGGFAYLLDGTDLLTVEVDGGKASVPEDKSELWYLSPTVVGTKGRDLVTLTDPSNKLATDELSSLAGAYAAISLFSVRMQPNVVLPLLKATGDVKFIQQFGGCFGKQKYSEFMDATKTAAFDNTVRCSAGWDPNKVPPDDAFTILDFLKVLTSEESNRVLLDSKDFKYTRIGRPAVPVVEKDADGKDIPGLEFQSDDSPDGYPVATLTYNEERPNVSILVRKDGTVDISKRLKGSGFEKKLQKEFKTFIFRNYTIVRDGIINIDTLPVRMTAGTVKQLVKAGFPMDAVRGLDGEAQDKAVARLKKASDDRPVSFVVDLKALPVINRNMVKEASAKVLFEKEWELTKARATQKVLNGIRKEKFPRESEGFKVLYGEDGAEWLKEKCAITDYSGFGPKTVKGEAQDKYMGKELKVSLKGLSSLPSVKEAQQKIASGKTTARHELLRPALKAVEEFEASDVLAKAKDKDKVYEAWLDDQLSDAKTQVRKLLYEVSQIRFAVILGLLVAKFPEGLAHRHEVLPGQSLR